MSILTSVSFNLIARPEGRYYSLGLNWKKRLANIASLTSSHNARAGMNATKAEPPDTLS